MRANRPLLKPQSPVAPQLLRPLSEHDLVRPIALSPEEKCRCDWDQRSTNSIGRKEISILPLSSFTLQVVVFNVDDRPVPIVHRIIRVHEKEDHSIDVLTKVRFQVSQLLLQSTVRQPLTKPLQIARHHCRRVRLIG